MIAWYQDLPFADDRLDQYKLAVSEASMNQG
jgi:hypothetical protein